MKKLNIVFLTFLIGAICFIAFSDFSNNTNLVEVESKTKNNSDLQEVESHIVEKSDDRENEKFPGLGKMPVLFKEAITKEEEFEKKEKSVEENPNSKVVSNEKNSELALKSEAEKIIDALFPDLTDSEEDKAIKKSLKYSFPKLYMKDLFDKEQLDLYFEIHNKMVAELEYLHGTTPIVDKKSEAIVNKTIREIKERFFVDCIKILTAEQQREFARAVSKESIPSYREGIKKFGVGCLRSPWFD